jgi:hypothetical protein
MRWIFATAGIALVAVVLVKLDAAEAAVFSDGKPNGPFGSDKCMEVKGNDDKPGTAVIVDSCEAGPDQQFEFAGPDPGFVGKVPSGQTIYAASGKRCLEVTNNSNVPGALVRIDDCKFDPGSLPGQQFFTREARSSTRRNPHCASIKDASQTVLTTSSLTFVIQPLMANNGRSNRK